MTEEHVHISHQISKLGANIPSVSLPAGPSCRPDAPCFKKCYARHGRFFFDNVKSPLERNFKIWKEDPQKFEREIDMAVYFCHWFRWFSSGDIPDPEFFEMMVRVATRNPDVKFLCFTKRYEFINNYIDSGRKIPDNLNVILSAWGDWIPENPYHLPMSYVILKDEPCDIPQNAHRCSGFCGDCVLGGVNCWTLQYGESVAFKQH